MASGTRAPSGPPDQMQRVRRKGDRHRRDGAGLDDEQQRPSVEEPRERMQTLAQVDVLPARPREERAKLRVARRRRPARSRRR